MIEGMTEYRNWLADPAKAEERAAYFGSPQTSREEWPLDTRDLVQRYTEIGNMALMWAVKNFELAAKVSKL